MSNYIIWFIASLISVFGYLYIFYKLFNVKYNHKFVLFAILTIASAVIGYFQYIGFKSIGVIFYFLFYPVYYCIFQKINMRKLVFYCAVIWIIGAIFDFLSMVTLSSIFSSKIVTYPIYPLLATILLYFIYGVLVNTNKFKRLILNSYTFSKNVKLIDISLVTFSILMFAMGMSIFYNAKNLKVSILLYVVVLNFIIIFSFLLFIKIHNVENKIFVKTLKTNNDFYTKMIDENKIFKHNFVNKLMAARSIADKKTATLLDDIINTYTSNENCALKYKEIPYGLKGIVYEKTYNYLSELNVKFSYSFKDDLLDLLNPRNYSLLAEKIGILLDNAIQASLKSKDKVLVINIYEENKYVVAEIINTFSDTLDIDQIGTKHYSTKGKNHGLGLFSIFRNSKVHLKAKIIDDKFVSIIKMKIK